MADTMSPQKSNTTTLPRRSFRCTTRPSVAMPLKSGAVAPMAKPPSELGGNRNHATPTAMPTKTRSVKNVFGIPAF